MATEHLPWASGKRKRPPGKKRSTRRRRKHQTLLSVAMSIAALTLLVAGLFTESLLYYLATGLMSLAVVAQRRAMAMEVRMADRSRGQTVPPPPRKARPGPPAADRAKKMREEAAAARNAGASTSTSTPPALIMCTASKKPVDDCDCASRHVSSEAGVRRYGLPLGSPLGRKKATT